ncbi:MAG TPA: ROK family protein [Polyangia bacterium]|nr:ROK family protein [Polyangia bacterium]
MRLGIDLGGTKIEGIVLSDGGAVVASQRVSTPTDSYASVLTAIKNLVSQLETTAGQRCSVGVGTPGFRSPRTGLISNSNLTTLNGHPIDRDLAEAMDRPVRVDNDANCFVLSEATDGAAAAPPVSAGAANAQATDVVFGATLGTGVGGGIVINGRVHAGANGSAAEWSHTTLPFLLPGERSPYACFCGRASCIESFISGRGLAGAYTEVAGQSISGPDVARLLASGDPQASQAFEIYAHRVARALAGVINLLDPRVIVLGGGVSNNASLFDLVPRLWNQYRVADDLHTDLVQAKHGDASGVRGAACLWPV